MAMENHRKMMENGGLMGFMVDIWIYPLVSSNMAGNRKSPINGDLNRNITDFYGPCSSKPSLITGV